MRGMNNRKSRRVSKAPGSVSKKLGQPVPLSYFICERNNGCPQPAQAKRVVATAMKANRVQPGDANKGEGA